MASKNETQIATISPTIKMSVRRGMYRLKIWINPLHSSGVLVPEWRNHHLLGELQDVACSGSEQDGLDISNLDPNFFCSGKSCSLTLRG
jgi:hypothetical protein